jgi:hypothetical protein
VPTPTRDDPSAPPLPQAWQPPASDGAQHGLALPSAEVAAAAAAAALVVADETSVRERSQLVRDKRLEQQQSALQQLQSELEAAREDAAASAAKLERVERARAQAISESKQTILELQAKLSAAQKLVEQCEPQRQELRLLTGEPEALRECSLRELQELAVKLVAASEACSTSVVHARLREQLSRDLMCPITQMEMRDPVVAADGHSYEREAIENWMREHQKSPMSGEALDHAMLLPNTRLKAIIRAIHTELA